MMQHFGIDRLIDYQVEKMDETTKVINPIYREIDNQVRIRNSKLFRKRAEYGALLIEGEIEENTIQEYVHKKAELKEVIDTMDKEIETLKAKRKETNKHISFSDLPSAEQFMDFKKSGKQFIDTIKMIAYRAETALVNILRSNILKKDEARTLVRQIFMTDGDIIPNEKQGILEIKIHNITNPRNNRYVQKLCDILNESEIIYSGTNLCLVYNLVSN